MERDEGAFKNSLVEANLREAMKKAQSQPVDIGVPALLRKIHAPRKVKSGNKWKVVDKDGHVYGTHDSEGDADKQLAALYAAKDK